MAADGWPYPCVKVGKGILREGGVAPEFSGHADIIYYRVSELSKNAVNCCNLEVLVKHLECYKKELHGGFMVK